MALVALTAASKTAGSAIQWATLAWIIGAALVAAVVITAIVLVSRRPKSIEDGIAQFARSLQAVAPRPQSGPRSSSSGKGRPAPEQRPLQRGET